MKGLLLLLSLLIISASGIEILRDLAKNHGLYVGSCSNAGHLTSDANYSIVLGQQYSIVTPENEMKWSATEPSRNQFTYTQGDTIVSYARKANQQIRGHNLCWGSYNPTWLTSGGFSGSELQSILQNHITNVVTHYKGQLYSWDVVNEAVSDSPVNSTDYLKPTVWYPAVPNFIDLAFTWAHAADPNVKLFYNDYSAEGSGAKSDAVYNMLKGMKERGIPVHGVGLQYHVSLGYSPNIADVSNNIKRLIALGLEVQITEMDVSIAGGNGNEASELQAQAAIYGQVLKTCLSFPNCTAFISWGFTDLYTWLGSNEQPLPFDTQYQPKPAFNTLAATLA